MSISPDLTLSRDQAIAWALRIGEFIKQDKTGRGPRAWALSLGLQGKPLEAVMEFFEGSEDEI